MYYCILLSCSFWEFRSALFEFLFLVLCCYSIVYADGSICLDILQNQWSPIYDVAAILTSIQVLFGCI